MDFYHKDKPFTDELFKNPPKEFRGTPFWAWNCKIDPKVIPEQIEVFKEMGFGGFHIHSRIGLDTEYLGKEFLDDVQLSLEEGRKRDMLTYLYDEDKWPSGYGAGRVTCHSEWRTHFLLFSSHPYEAGYYRPERDNDGTVGRNGEIQLVACYRIIQNSEGRILRYERFPVSRQIESKHIWYLYEGVVDPLPWFNNQGYVDVLSKEAITAFTKVTHDVYAKRFQSEFGKNIPSIFTDEPQFYKISNLAGSMAGEAGIPYTPALPDAFRTESGRDLLDVIPEFFLEVQGESAVRYQLMKVISRLFSENYAGTLGAWCDRHGILLTGHLMKEPTLDSQSRSVGETMASYRYFGIPGIDMLANRYEYTTAKQVESAVHQWDKPGALSELYGVTNWDFDFRGHLSQGNWQAALGITTRVPHLSWMSMGGEAKRDYPAAIDAHSPWYREYRQVENHFARVNTAMTRGRAVVAIALVHPVESYWQQLGPDDLTGASRKQLETQFKEVTEGLLFHSLDFDYLCESTLPELYRESSDDRLHVGPMAYQVVVVPPMSTIRNTTLHILLAFAGRGGKVLFVGEKPSSIDGRQARLPEALVSRSESIPFSMDSLVSALSPYRTVAIRQVADGSQMPRMLYQLREEANGERWLFVCHAKKLPPEEVESRPRDPHLEHMLIQVRGQYSVAWYDTMRGEHHAIPAVFDGTYTCARIICYPHDAALLRLTKKAESEERALVQKQVSFVGYLPSNLPYRLSEPNCCVLDVASWQLEDGEVQPEEEMLRIDNAVRARLGYAQRDANLPQPWLVKGNPDTPVALTLTFRVESDLEVPVDLAFEDHPLAISLNGSLVAMETGTWFVDRALHRIHLGVLQKGVNVIAMRYGFTRKTTLENAFLLGDFGVTVSGSRLRIVGLPSLLGFGSYAGQGLPFYGGNVTYRAQIETDGMNSYAVMVPLYQAPLVAVSLDGKRVGSIIGEPYQASLGRPAKGKHTLELVSYGSRINQFGQLHTTVREMYWGPRSWRMAGPYWSYTYRLRPVGILSDPLLLMEEEHHA